MPGPGLVFAFILATLYGVIFHLILGGDARRLALFLLSSWIGFVFGQFLGLVLEIDLFRLGGLRVLPATIGAFFTLFAVRALTTGQRRRRPIRRGRTA
jgi:uncharacterized membrane protein YeaQ/YmgE (transglycosylase-associated protein family)